MIIGARCRRNEPLRAIAAAAVQAPSGMNRQAWRVIVVKNGELMREMEKEGMARLAGMEDRSLYNRIMERGGRLFYGAPAMIVVPIDPAQYAPALMDCGIRARTSRSRRRRSGSPTSSAG